MVRKQSLQLKCFAMRMERFSIAPMNSKLLESNQLRVIGQLRLLFEGIIEINYNIINICFVDANGLLYCLYNKTSIIIAENKLSDFFIYSSNLFVLKFK